MGASLFRERAPESNSSGNRIFEGGRTQSARAMLGSIVRGLAGSFDGGLYVGFLEAEDTLPDRLRFSLSAHYESLCMQVLDPDEIDLPDAEAMRFREMEGERKFPPLPR